MLSQQDLAIQLIPLMRQKGKCYAKFKSILATKAIGGEVIETVTSDGVETRNQANAGDYIVQNSTEARERYIVSSKKFESRYQFETSLGDGIARYKPTGKVIAVEVDDRLLKHLAQGETFHIMAPWKDKMVVKKNDFLVTSLDFREVYRIARKEFFETYRVEE